MLYSILVSVHVGAGCVGLATFWLAAALRKGTRLHRRIGATYLLALCVVIATTPFLAAAAFAAGQPVIGTFLAYLTVITATAAWSAWRAIRDRAAPAAFFGRGYVALAWLNLASGAVVLALGLATNQLVLVGMSVIGLALGVDRLRRARRPVITSGWWLRQHYAAILGCGIATHIAFLSIGLRKLLPEWATLTPYLGWFAPLAIAMLAKVWLDRRYGRGARGAALVGPRAGAETGAGATAR